MIAVLLYGAVVLIWGSSWIMIKFQLGVVPAEVSVAYRFALASVVMFAWALSNRLPLRLSLRDHAYIALQGMLICSMKLLESTGTQTTFQGLSNERHRRRADAKVCRGHHDVAQKTAVEAIDLGRPLYHCDELLVVLQ